MSRTDADREAMSALLDGEASEMDLARVLRAVDEPELRADWVRQQRIRSALRGEPESIATIDVTAGVRAALESRPSKARHPLIGVAVAASFTVAVVFGGQQYLGAHAPVAMPQVPGGVVAVQGTSAMQASASFGSPQRQQPVTQSRLNRVRTAQPATTGGMSRYDRLAQDRFERLVQDHAAASAPVQPNALIPYARIPESLR